MTDIVSLMNFVGGSIANNVFNIDGAGGMYVASGFLIIFVIYLLATGKVSLSGFVVVLLPLIVVLTGMFGMQGGLLPSNIGAFAIIAISLIFIVAFYKFFRA